MTKNVRLYLSGFSRKWVVSACVYQFANQQRKLHKNTKIASKNNFYCCKSLILMHIEECPHIRLYIRLHTRKRETPLIIAHGGTISFRPNFYIDFLLNQQIYHGPLSVNLTRLNCTFVS